jgi:hypothetical protein
MATRKPVTGGCLCGAVRYEASVSPTDAHYCHCRMCQRAFGNAFATFVSFPLDKFRWVRGRPKMYQSSKIARRGFCARCGTPLVFRNVYRDNRIGISIGSLDHPELAPPEIHWGIESIVPWLKIADRLPRKHTMQDPSVADAWTLAKKRARVRKRSAV